MIFYYPDRVSSETDTDCRETKRRKSRSFTRGEVAREPERRGERTASRKSLPHRFATAAGEGARVRMLERTKKTVV